MAPVLPGHGGLGKPESSARARLRARACALGQDFNLRNLTQGYIRAVALPKIATFYDFDTAHPALLFARKMMLEKGGK